jgi:hypothetical protein
METVEATVVRGRGASVQTIVPDAGSRRAMGRDFMDARVAPAVAVAAYAQGLAIGATPTD